MDIEAIQDLCAQGQELLMSQQYIEAEQLLLQAEREALHQQDWDSLARLYMPLQEARRQRRQRATQGVVCLDLLSQGHSDHIEGRHVIENYPHGQLLVAGWGTIEPALRVRKLRVRFRLYIDVFLAAVYPLIGGGNAVVIVPHEHATLPEVAPRRFADIGRVMPHHSIILKAEQLPQGVQRPTPELNAMLQGWWEKLHQPFLSEARETHEPRRRIEAYRKVLRVDYACEFAHQELAATARELSRLSARSP